MNPSSSSSSSQPLSQRMNSIPNESPRRNQKANLTARAIQPRKVEILEDDSYQRRDGIEESLPEEDKKEQSSPVANTLKQPPVRFRLRLEGIANNGGGQVNNNMIEAADMDSSGYDELPPNQADNEKRVRAQSNRRLGGISNIASGTQDIFYSARSTLTKHFGDIQQHLPSGSVSNRQHQDSAIKPNAPLLANQQQPTNIYININQVHFNPPPSMQGVTSPLSSEHPPLLVGVPGSMTFFNQAMNVKNPAKTVIQANKSNPQESLKKAPTSLIARSQGFSPPQSAMKATSNKDPSVMLNKNVTAEYHNRGSDMTRKQLQKQAIARALSVSNQIINVGPQMTTQRQLLVMSGQQQQFRSPKVGGSSGYKSSPINKKRLNQRKKSVTQNINLGVPEQKSSFQFMNDEEEKVPNEHPIKTNAVGLGYYQTNYFSQSIESQNHFQDQVLILDRGRSNKVIQSETFKSLGVDSGMHFVQNNKRDGTYDSKEDEKSPINEIYGGSFTAKKRKPTLMPYNLPGDDIDHLEKTDKLKQINSDLDPMIPPGFLLHQNYMYEMGGVLPGESEIYESDHFNTFEQARQQSLQNYQSMMRPQNNNTTVIKVPVKDPREMSQQELINEVELLRNEAKQKDTKIKKVGIEGQRLRRETQQLSIKLQFELKNNSLLLKNLNRLRHNYFQVISSPSKVSKNPENGNFDPNQFSFAVAPDSIPPRGNDIGMIQANRGRGAQLRGANPNMIMSIQDRKVATRMQQQRKVQMTPQNRTGNLISGFPFPQSSQPERLPNSDPSDSLGYNSNHMVEQPPNNLNLMNQPPTRASQGGAAILGRMNKNQGIINRGNNARRQNLQQLLRHHQQRRQGQRMNPVEEDASLLETQQNDESILVNKVNEMQIKTSRFDQPFLHHYHSHLNHTYYRNDDLIPNEEPLINVREFWGGDLSHNLRMRYPYHQQQLAYGTPHQLRMMLQPASHGMQNFGYYERQSRYPPPYFQLLRNQQVIQPNRRVLAGGAVVNMPGGPNNMFIAAGGGTGPRIDNHGARIRVASHGPPLRNIIGDSQSLLEEDQQDQTNQILGTSHNHNNNPGSMNNSHLAINLSASQQQLMMSANNHYSSQNQLLQHQYLSDDSILDFEEEEKHQALPLRNHQMFLQVNNRGGFGSFRPMGPGTNGPMAGLHAGGFSFDDGGMDEYDVADERVHLWEYINPDNMTYEEIIALQDRVGYVTKGLTLEKINSFPKMKRKEVLAYLKKLHSLGQTPANHKSRKDQEEEKKSALNDLSHISEIVPLDEFKLSSQTKKQCTQSMHQRRIIDDDIDEIIDGDEGIVNRRLPINSYHHQIVQHSSTNQIGVKAASVLHQAQGPRKQLTANFGMLGKSRANDGEEEGCENCREEDEERKDAELIEQCLSRQVFKDKDSNHLDVHSVFLDADAGFDPQLIESPSNHSETLIGQNPLLLNNMPSQSESKESTQHHERCAVCFDTMRKNDFVKVLTCGHYYHIECIDQWLLVEKRCPMCMTYLDKDQQPKI